MPKKVTLSFILSLAKERNSRLQFFQKKIEANNERYSQMRYLIEMQKQYQAFENNTISVSAYPFPHMESIMGKIVINDIMQSQKNLSIALKNLIYDISREYYDLIFTKKTLSIYAEHLKIIQTLEDISKEKYKVGLINYSNVLEIQIEKEQVQNAIRNEQQKEISIRERILHFLETKSEKFQDVEEKNSKAFSFSLVSIYELAMNHNLEIQLMQLRKKKMQYMIELASEKLYPDFTDGSTSLGQRKKKPPVWFGTSESYIRELKLRKLALKKIFPKQGRR